MKHIILRSLLLVASVSTGSLLINAQEATGPSALRVTCGDQNASFYWDDAPWEGSCREGMVTFRGTDYPDTVDLKVLSYPVGTLIDSALYDTNLGSLQFTQTLVPAGTYQLQVSVPGEGGALLNTQFIVVDPLR